MEKTIPDNLTYEQFKALAEREPSLEGNWIYRLRHKKHDRPWGGPESGLWRDDYMFLTLQDAENYISELIKDGSGGTWCFTIQQIPIGPTDDKHGAEWLYDRDGKLVDYTNTIQDDNDPMASAFFGRPDSRIRFHKGDIVMVEDHWVLHPAVVASDGPTVDWFWGLYNRTKDKYGYPADYSDDCYYLLYGPGHLYHAHVSPTGIMPFPGKVPDEIRAYFDRCLELAEKGENDRNVFTRPSFGCKSDLTDISETKIGIIYDSDARRHRLVLREYNHLTDSETIKTLPDEVSIEELSRIKDWLNQVKYGKTRLWYIIRQWDLDNDDPDAHLPLSTTLEELLTPYKK